MPSLGVSQFVAMDVLRAYVPVEGASCCGRRHRICFAKVEAMTCPHPAISGVCGDILYRARAVTADDITQC